ncbi:hypothetical protein [Desulfosporosinus lacus]|uniref:Short chain dehydrogenase n=1 Tax=Desulfosporosinus lacus DSM 15449 TaxID=1121420 RepID=A0A1M5ZU34_9FIRM|nr:hypothetical protein [Desulfosporosinus lacus]SHI27805.1 hypothetical protein SAMN02746098_03671 [Desulfosporosinus lacus DSM 15449]
MRYFIKRCQFDHDITIHSPKDGNEADITLKEIKAAYPKIDGLVNNAGIHSFEQRMALEGFAEMMVVNYLETWVLSYT